MIRAKLPSKPDPLINLGDGDGMQVACTLKACLHGDRVILTKGLASYPSCNTFYKKRLHAH